MTSVPEFEEPLKGFEMPSFGPYTVSGFGHQAVNGTTSVQDVTTVVTALGPDSTNGQRGPPFKVGHVGYVGIACFSDDEFGCDPPSVFWSSQVSWDVQVNLEPTTVENLVCPSVFWKLNDGVTLQITVNTA